MARVGDLPLAPGEPERRRSSESVEPDARAQELIDTVEEMLGEGYYNFAEDTLLGILSTVKARGRITLGHRRAIENIYNSKREIKQGEEDQISWRY